VQSAGDRPVSKNTVPLIDEVSIDQAACDADAKTLTVSASSSDRAPAPDAPTLTATGFGPRTSSPTVFRDVIVPPNVLTITSSARDSSSRSVSLVGKGFPPVSTAASANAPLTVAIGAAVTLDGTASTR
jgi:hypothetical protein